MVLTSINSEKSEEEGKKTIKAAVVYLTKVKEQLLSSEYDALQADMERCRERVQSH